jgi:16S rRNA (cytosine1402-N4)-methyltransferase
MKHIPVLLSETIEALQNTGTKVFVDGTFGGGGHSQVLLTENPDAFVICVDLDPLAQNRFSALALPKDRSVFIQENYAHVEEICTKAGKTHIDGVLLDLGTSAYQLLEDTRGFSFMKSSPLQMTFGEGVGASGLTAYDIVNGWDEENIALILYRYGDEKASRKIAHAIVTARAEKPIETSGDLATVILKCIPRKGKIHPATKTFQALRIAVNNELEILQQAIHGWYERLAPKGRLAVITFHSLEDRIVKHFMKSKNGRVITKKPIVPTREEILSNPKSRSAKLRVIEKNHRYDNKNNRYNSIHPF